MGEPYDARDCPVCGSTNTYSWSHATKLQLGYGAACSHCKATWDLVNADDEDGLDAMAVRGYLAASNSPPAASFEELLQRYRTRHS